MTPADDRPEFPIDPFPHAGPRWESATPEDEEAFIAAVEKGIADSDAGRTIAGDDITAWIRSLETDNPLPWPQCK